VGEGIVGTGLGPVVMRRRNGAWESVATPSVMTQKLRAVWVESPTRRWIIGAQGVFLHEDAPADGKPWKLLRDRAADVVVAGGEVWVTRSESDARGTLCRYLGPVEHKFDCVPFPGAPGRVGSSLAVVDGRPVAVAEGRPTLVAELRDGVWTQIPAEDISAPLSVWGTGEQLWIGGTERLAHRSCQP